MSKKNSESVQNESSVIISKIEAASGNIGVLTLNSVKTLNSLTLEMVEILTTTLEEWANDDTISAVLLKGEGPKAFCAGGDVQALYHSSTNQTDGKAVDAEQFFFKEYQLNYLIHCYDKPLICIAHGVVMGGGLGLLAGASHRVVTDSTRMAMPEITIGLFPDVGGTYFLNQVPYNLGYFLALTGVPLNASDAVFCQLADKAVLDKDLSKLEKALAKLKLNDDQEKNHEAISKCLDKFKPEKGELAHSEIKQNLPTLEASCRFNSLCKIVEAIDSFDEDNPFLSKAKATMNAGSPTSLLLIYEQLKRHRYDDLQSIFKSELVLATNIVRASEFAEGVRALLIDKDKEPKWQYSHFSEIPCSVLEGAFTPPWDVNPLENSLT